MTSRVNGLPYSACRQGLLTEFAKLRYSSPQGVYISLTPGDPSKWAGVIFVRKGPYAPAILRFRISFPRTYPDVPPIVTFSTDIFHPLLTPLTTYVHASSTIGSTPTSTADEERLPPGGFSLKHGFPQWHKFSIEGALLKPGVQFRNASLESGTATPKSSISGLSASPEPARRKGKWTQPPVTQILRYIRSCFGDEEVLDSIPFECAANTSAWRARQFWREQQKAGLRGSNNENKQEAEEKDDMESLSDDSDEDVKSRAANIQEPPNMDAQKLGLWDWEGVWETRTKAGIDGSLADPVLFGNAAGGDDLIHFMNMDEQSAQTIRENMQRSLDMSGLR